MQVVRKQKGRLTVQSKDEVFADVDGMFPDKTVDSRTIDSNASSTNFNPVERRFSEKNKIDTSWTQLMRCP